jgi:hypothetical protein
MGGIRRAWWSSGVQYLKRGTLLGSARAGWHKVLRDSVMCIALLALPSVWASGQSTEFDPELDTYLTLGSRVRVSLQAKGDRDGGVPQQFQFGPSIQVYMKPLLRLKRYSSYDLDEAKHRALVWEIGYRVLTAPNEDVTNRLQPVVTSHFPLVAGFLLSDKNDADLDWKGSEFSWQYQNELTLQRTIRLGSYHPIPYVAVEPYYTSKYGKWSTTDLYVGSQFPVGKHTQFDAYFEHENNTGKHPNQQQNTVGLALLLYFSTEK